MALPGRGRPGSRAALRVRRGRHASAGPGLGRHRAVRARARAALPAAARPRGLHRRADRYAADDPRDLRRARRAGVGVLPPGAEPASDLPGDDRSRVAGLRAGQGGRRRPHVPPALPAVRHRLGRLRWPAALLPDDDGRPLVVPDPARPRRHHRPGHAHRPARSTRLHDRRAAAPPAPGTPGAAPPAPGKRGRPHTVPRLAGGLHGHLERRVGLPDDRLDPAPGRPERPARRRHRPRRRPDFVPRLPDHEINPVLRTAVAEADRLRRYGQPLPRLQLVPGAAVDGAVFQRGEDGDPGLITITYTGEAPTRRAIAYGLAQARLRHLPRAQVPARARSALPHRPAGGRRGHEPGATPGGRAPAERPAPGHCRRRRHRHARRHGRRARAVRNRRHRLRPIAGGRARRRRRARDRRSHRRAAHAPAASRWRPPGRRPATQAATGRSSAP